MNKNHLRHNLKCLQHKTLDRYFICENCKVTGYFTNNIYIFWNTQSDLTCEEQQIKNLLE